MDWQDYMEMIPPTLAAYQEEFTGLQFGLQFAEDRMETDDSPDIVRIRNGLKQRRDFLNSLDLQRYFVPAP